MTFFKIKSHAKVNLALNITGKSSNLHKIESIVAFISLHDEILIKKVNSKKHKISFSGKFSKNIGKNNTISKLLELLEKKNFLNNKKFQIKINKRIPNKAGLGGGSMNAANLLRYFLKKKIIKISKKNLIEVSKLIGSDVILGLKPVNTILTSKNEIKRFTKYKKIYILVVKPNFGCSTKEIYSKVKKFEKPKFNQPSIKMFNFDYLKKLNNSLEKVAFAKYNKLNIVKTFLENFIKPDFVRMTGSGSALVAYFKSKEKCDNAQKIFTNKYRNYWCISSKTI
jgi:4-diphosphocytidyl-2-C-methyl-D-erythritol kinase|tara:strand:+ start:173 stop:1018 length:846 start_codon:yes stop_codon:yes gene_type:complete